MTKIFCAIDTPHLSAAEEMLQKLKGHVDGFKLGLEFFTAHGRAGVAKLRSIMGDAPFFLDLKLHDIPNTVAGATRAAAACGADFLTVHASGGLEMMKAAVASAGNTKILAVTVLTALSSEDLAAIGQGAAVKEQVLRLAKLALEAGVAGVVCAPHEIDILRSALPRDFLLVVPGIRPAEAAHGDQKRVMTPLEAASRGADWLVIGRPITEAADPVLAARALAI